MEETAPAAFAAAVVEAEEQWPPSTSRRRRRSSSSNNSISRSAAKKRIDSELAGAAPDDSRAGGWPKEKDSPFSSFSSLASTAYTADGAVLSSSESDGAHNGVGGPDEKVKEQEEAADERPDEEGAVAVVFGGGTNGGNSQRDLAKMALSRYILRTSEASLSSNPTTDCLEQSGGTSNESFDVFDDHPRPRNVNGNGVDASAFLRVLHERSVLVQSLHSIINDGGNATS